MGISEIAITDTYMSADNATRPLIAYMNQYANVSSEHSQTRKKHN